LDHHKGLKQIGQSFSLATLLLRHLTEEAQDCSGSGKLLGKLVIF
jgi:hypothetical protein